jgi:cytochrome b561
MDAAEPIERNEVSPLVVTVARPGSQSTPLAYQPTFITLNARKIGIMQASGNQNRQAGRHATGPLDSVVDAAERADTRTASAAPVRDVPARGGVGLSERPEGGYSRQQRWLHWSVAVLVVLQLTVGTIIGTLAEPSQHNTLVETLLTIHVIVGTVIFGLMVVRLLVRRRRGAPPSPEGTPFDASVLARVNHLGFYALLLTLPVLGWLAYLTKPPAAILFGSIHGAVAVILVLAICAHLSGVVFHQFIRRDGLLRRMTG